ncbi:MAG: isochorismatase family protein [Rhodospirillaceae bacterium]|nr:isochorismatase family protein [Rhodospirillaceae bacterium]
MLLEAKRSILVIIDLQQKLNPAIDKGAEVVARAEILIEGARQMGVPVIVSEQYPKGLGPTIESVAEKLPNESKTISKLTFSAMRSADFARKLATLRAEGRDQMVVCGTEAHICVMQTVADLLAEDAPVFLVNDAVGSRAEHNRQAGIARMAQLGAQCVTSEMVLFEWLEVAGSDEFKVISKLII